MPTPGPSTRPSASTWRGSTSAPNMVGNELSLFAIDKGPLLLLVPSIVTVTAWRSLNGNGALQPCMTYGTPPGCYVTSRVDGDTQRIRRIDPPLDGPTLTSLGTVQTKVGNTPPSAPALGSSVNLDTLDARHMNSVYRNGSIWLAHCVARNGRPAINWYEIDPVALAVVQEGTVKSDVDSYCYPTIAVNSAGDAVLGFSAASPAMYAGAWYAGRRSTDLPRRNGRAGPLPGRVGALQPARQRREPLGLLQHDRGRSERRPRLLDDPGARARQRHVGHAHRRARLRLLRAARLAARRRRPLPRRERELRHHGQRHGPLHLPVAEGRRRHPGRHGGRATRSASVAPADAGSYACLVGNACGSITSAPAVLDGPRAARRLESERRERLPAHRRRLLDQRQRQQPLRLPVAQGRRRHPGRHGRRVTRSLPSAAGDAGTYDVRRHRRLRLAHHRLRGPGGPRSAERLRPERRERLPGAPPSPSRPAPAAAAPLTYQWRKDGVDIGGATAPTLNLASTVAGDAGAYDVVVTNACGSVTSDAASLNVDEAPSITAQPVSVTPCDGAAAALSVTATGAAPLAYQWRKDGADIGGATAASYAIPAVTAADVGVYDVVVTNGCGSVTSDPTTIAIADPVTATDPADLTLCPACRRSSRPRPAARARSPTSGSATGWPWPARTGTATRSRPVASGHAGDYSVEVSGTCGTLETAAATLARSAGPWPATARPARRPTAARRCSPPAARRARAPRAASSSSAGGLGPNVSGAFFWGTNGPQANPWGNGTSWMCVVPPVFRGSPCSSAARALQARCDATLAYDLTTQWQAKPASNPGAGTVTQVQLWYRDPLNTSNQKTSPLDALGNAGSRRARPSHGALARGC